MRTALLLFNSKGGSINEGDLEAIRTTLEKDLSLEVLAIDETQDPVNEARRAVQRGVSAVIACGGDGTVSAVATALVGSDVPMGIIPRGTANSVARYLDIPSEIELACQTIVQGHVRRIDTAEVADRTMVLMAATGVHADVITETQSEAKAKFGVFAYAAKSFELLGSSAPFELELTIDDDAPFRFQCNTLTIANLAPHTSVWAQGPADVNPEDGLLDVTIVAMQDTFEALLTGIHLYRSALASEPADRENVIAFRCKQLRVQAEPAQRLMVDGEDVGSTPYTVTSKPKSLSVLVPAPTS